jgi:arylsulfatase A-like enzyme
VVFTSDHGEEFYEHGGFDHSRTLFDELLLVPLAVWFPDGESAGTRTDLPVSLIDVVPTVMAAAGLSPDPTLPGSDLRALLAEPDEAPRVIAAETDPEGQGDVWAEVALRCTVMEDLKCIVSDGATDRFGQPVPAIRCFDLARDPGETTPLDGPRIADAVSRACMDSLSTLLPRDGQHDNAAITAPISEEARARLRALGYLGD